ncbi:hypothetical protein PHISP_08394 [Aspergillus sp. HF37]|nr:hypothetical protein PHISP_08394 [Aspergillus sp. HF37]
MNQPQMNQPQMNQPQMNQPQMNQPQMNQPQNNFMQPQPSLQPQQTAFNTNNPYGTDVFSQQQQIPQIQQPQESFPTAGNHNPWAQQPSADALKPMPTGSNNPFANRTPFQPRPQTSSGPPSLNTLSEDRTTNQFPSSQFSSTNQYSSTHLNPIANYQAQPGLAPPKSTPPQMQNPHHAHLNTLLSSGEGQDTFGNVGDLRIPAQHTAPGTFVNSSGQGLDRLRGAQTGNNPFFGQQQTGFAQPNNNPWGGAQYQRPPQQGSSLIDL